MADSVERRPSPNPEMILSILRQLQAVERDLKLYVFGVLDEGGIDRERFVGIDDTNGDLLLRAEEDGE